MTQEMALFPITSSTKEWQRSSTGIFLPWNIYATATGHGDFPMAQEMALFPIPYSTKECDRSSTGIFLPRKTRDTANWPWYFSMAQEMALFPIPCPIQEYHRSSTGTPLHRKSLGNFETLSAIGKYNSSVLKFLCHRKEGHFLKLFLDRKSHSNHRISYFFSYDFPMPEVRSVLISKLVTFKILQQNALKRDSEDLHSEHT